MNTKLKCLLLDDELPGLTYLKMLCEQMPDLEVVRAFSDPQALLSEQAGLDYNLCISDIEMPGTNGLELASALKDKLIIFTTAYKEFAAEAFDLDAVDYIRKPVTKERLEQAVAKAKARLSTNQQERKFIQLNTDKGKAIIYLDQILYIKTSEIDSRDKSMLLEDKRLVTLKNISFEALQQSLPNTDFVRINKKEIIGMRAVQLFSANEITTNFMVNNAPLRLMLSEVYRGEFIGRLRL